MPSRQTLLVIVVLVSQFATIVAAYGDHAYWTVIPPWWLSLTAAALLVVGPSAWRAVRPSVPLRDAIIVSAVTLLAGLLRFPNLERLPSGIHGDEGEFAAAGLAISQGHGPPLFGVAFLGDPAAYPHLLSLFIDVLGPDMAAVRLPSAIVGTLTVPALYLLVRALANRPEYAELLRTAKLEGYWSRSGSQPDLRRN